MPPAKTTVDLLVSCLKDASAERRLAAASALLKLVASRPEAMDVLIECSRDVDAIVRSHAAYSLSKFGRGEKKTKETFVRMLNDPDGNVKVRAAVALLNIDKSNAAAKVVLIDALHSRNLRYAAIFECRNLTAYLDEIDSALSDHTRDRDKSMRQEAEESLADLRKKRT